MAAKKRQPAILSLQIGLAAVFTYAAVSSLLHPADWIGYLPSSLRHSHYASDLLKVFAIYEIGLAIWLLSGKYLKWVAILSAATMAGIILFNLDALAVSFRDIGLGFAAIALFFLTAKE